MKKKSKDLENMSPRELARYAVIHAIDDLEEYYKDRSENNGSKYIQTKRSLYEARIQGLSKDEYIEYLEQLLRENEYQRHKTSIEYRLCRNAHLGSVETLLKSISFA
ncbi:MAG: hypothetical protein ACC612_05645 [Methanomethylovorans sp.]|uniref:hypothetical protein n=1 Tax=Methanomethylovorans sp. TaxID=2758717 RepID=UPI003531254A